MKKALLILLLTAAFAPVSYGQWVCWDNAISFDPADSGLTGYLNWQRAITIDTIHYHHNIWQVGKPQKAIFDSAHSYPDVIVTDTLYPYPPNDTSAFILTFPGHTAYCWIEYFSFYYQLNMDSNSIAKIEFSPDSGRSWINLADSTPIGTTIYDTSFSTLRWQRWFFTINFGYVGNDSMKFRFTFISGNDTTGKDGWMIDNIGIAYYTESVPTIQNPTTLTIFPNPATTQLTISSANEPINDITISNLLGQVVYQQHGSAPLTMTLNISSFPSGIYFIKVNGDPSAGLRMTGKFLKE